MTTGLGPASLPGHRRQSSIKHKPSIVAEDSICCELDDTTEEVKKSLDSSLAWPARSLRRRRVFQEVFHTFYEQVLHGCGDTTCHTPTCASYRKRKSKGPFRPYTVLSARALAAHLASGDHPSQKICPSVKAKRTAINDLESTAEYLQGWESSRTTSSATGRKPKEALTSLKTIVNGATLDTTYRATKISTSGSLKQNEAIPACLEDGSPAIKQEDLTDPTDRDESAQTVKARSKPKSNGARRKKHHVSEGIDQKSLTQNLFDTAAMTLLQLTRTPYLAPIASNFVANDKYQESKNCACGSVVESMRGTIMQVVGTKASPKMLSSNKSHTAFKTACCSQDEHMSSLPDRAILDVTQRRQNDSRADSEVAPHLTHGDYRILKSASEFCEYRNLHGNPVVFCLPKRMIDCHCMPLKPGTVLQPTSQSKMKVFEPCGKPSKEAVSLCRDWMAEDMGNWKALMVRTLGRTDHATPIYQCKKRHHESPHTSLAKSVRSQCNLLCSRNYLLSLFIRKRMVEDALIVVWSIDFLEMVENFEYLHTFGTYPEAALPNLWKSARFLFVEHPSRTTLPSPIGPSLSPDTSEFQSILSLPEAAHVVKIVLAALVGSIRVSRTEAWLAVQRLRRGGHIVLPRPANNPLVPCATISDTLDIMDAFEDDIAHSLVRRLAMALASRRNSEKLTHHSYSDDEQVSSDHNPEISDLIVRALVEIDVLTLIPAKANIQPTLLGGTLYRNPKGPTLLGKAKVGKDRSLLLEIVVEWLRGLLLKDWDGSAEVSTSSAVAGVLELLSGLYKHYGERYLSPEIFETSFIAERLDVVDTPLAWINSKDDSSKIHLLNYPFLFHSSILVSYFRAINHATMAKAFQESMSNTTVALRLTYTSFDTGDRGRLRLGDRLSKLTDNYLVLEIRRQDVLTDALNQLWRRRKRELVRPLKVRLGEDEGEEGIDHGGVQQEFFRVAIAEALDPKYGAFTTDPVTRMSWFQPGSLEPLYKFELLGILTSLAIYNGLTLPFTFPIALYMKLLDHQPDHMEDISDGWPELSKGLRALGEWADGDVQDVFCRSYVFSMDVFGTTEDVHMSHSASSASRPSTPEIPMVTNANRTQYISDYIRHLTHESIHAQYEAFAKGFKTVIEPKSLSLFTPNALQALVQGMPHINTYSLEAVTRYEGGYNRRHRVIQDFWNIVHSWSSAPSFKRKEAGQIKVRQLLEFVTASDRLPVGGELRMLFVVQKNGVGDERLPTSLTCFGRLLLPEYTGRRIMEEMLSKAVENGKGFGQP